MAGRPRLARIGARHAGVPFKTHIDILRAAPLSTRLQPKPLKIPVTLNGNKTFVEPDALFAMHGRTYALEADKGTESIKAVIVPKILAYREIVAAGIIDNHLAVDNLTVLFATTSETRMRNVMDELASIARYGKSTMFAFRAEPGFGGFLRTPPPSGRLRGAQAVGIVCGSGPFRLPGDRACFAAGWAAQEAADLSRS